MTVADILRACDIALHDELERLYKDLDEHRYDRRKAKDMEELTLARHELQLRRNRIAGTRERLNRIMEIEKRLRI